MYPELAFQPNPVQQVNYVENVLYITYVYLRDTYGVPVPPFFPFPPWRRSSKTEIAYLDNFWSEFRHSKAITLSTTPIPTSVRSNILKLLQIVELSSILCSESSGGRRRVENHVHRQKNRFCGPQKVPKAHSSAESPPPTSSTSACMVDCCVFPLWYLH